MFSFWQQDAFLHPADVVIAGGGFMGLWSAYELKKQYPRLTITVLEKDVLLGGASVRNAGFACFGSPGELITDAATMGEETMWQIVEMRYKGMSKLRKVLGDTLIDYDACGGYECFRDKHLFQQVAAQLTWLNAGLKNITGINNTFSVTDAAIETLGMKNFRHLIANSLEGGLHSGKMIKALLQKLYIMGVTILYGTGVKSWYQAGDKILVETSSIITTTITANKLLIATNALASQLTKSMLVQPARGQIMITQPINGLLLKGTFHYDTGYYYWRNVGNRVLLGGARNLAFESEQTYEIETSDTIQQALENFLRYHLNIPLEKIIVDFAWAGIMGFTKNKQPSIQMLESNVWAAMACNGMGVALAPVLAEQVTVQMMG